jgi:hypothetical protein
MTTEGLLEGVGVSREQAGELDDRRAARDRHICS